MKLIGKVLLGTGLLAVALTATTAQAAMIYDGTFAAANWTYTIGGYNGAIWTVPVSGPSGSAAQTPGGGNPGDYRLVSLTQDGNGYPAEGFSIYNSAYNPSTQGAINTLSMSIDAINAGPAQALGFALYQNNYWFMAGAPYSTPASWTTFSAANLGAGDFNGFGMGAPLHPDFSGAGGDIMFGFVVANSGTPFWTSQVAYDNFSAAINVPEPGTVALLGLGGVLLALGARRRKA